MSTVWLTIYVLMWPVLVAAVLFVIARGVVQEWRQARSSGEDMI